MTTITTPKEKAGGFALAGITLCLGVYLMVIDHECVTRTFPEGPGEIDLVMIYQTAGERIVKAWSVAGEKRLFGR
tara:strand:+ start:905 stop:1129 length:225 start_codon:yes stop_codon:yes gene_type:complete